MKELGERLPMDDPLARCPYCYNNPYGYRYYGSWRMYPSCFCHEKIADVDELIEEMYRDEIEKGGIQCA